MKQKTTILTFLSLLLCIGLFATPVSKKMAIQAAKKWVKNMRNSPKNSKREIATIDETYHQSKLVYFVIKFKGGGFIIVSADNTTKPILAYSDSSDFDSQLQNETVEDLMTAYKNFVYENSNNSLSGRNSNIAHPGWDKLLNDKRSLRRKTIIAPLMDDIFYTQSRGFQKFCPKNEKGQSIVGCVATAMAQVMRYWEFPKRGKGSNSYNHKEYGKISADFENQIYDWDNMSKIRADDENALLSFHCGVAVSMNYGTSADGGSSAYSASALSALKRYFKYNRSARMVYRYNYSDENWNKMIKKQLDKKRPVVYTGRSENLQDPEAGSAGHLFVLDGYDTNDQGDYFHINWGWGGNNNGYFYLTEMISHGGKYNWIDNNAIMLNLYPTNMAPEFTSKPKNWIRTGNKYEYTINVEDENRQDTINITFKSLPKWMTVSEKNGDYTIYGTPTESSNGVHKVSIIATDGTKSTKQEFSIIVLGNDEIIETNTIDFETADFSQANFSNNAQNTFSISKENNHFANSGEIQDSQNSTLTLLENFSVETNIKFDYMVSSEKRYDFLIFKIDEKEQKRWSGEIPWSSASFRIPAGKHSLQWIYKKDRSEKKGKDLAGIDNISYQTIKKDNVSPEAPLNLEATGITNISISLNWDASKDNIKVKHYEVFRNNVKIATTKETNFIDKNIYSDKVYSFFVKAVDFAGNVSKKSSSVEIKTTTKTYCKSEARNSKYEWIDFVSYGGMNNQSGSSSGYYDFTNKKATIVTGTTNDLIIRGGFSGDHYTEHYNVWIDYNQNNEFEAEEKVASTSSSSDKNLIFNITTPKDVLLGETRMRISLKYYQPAAACDFFNDGEVEDYTVNIIENSSRNINEIAKNKIISNNIVSGKKAELSIYPNPTYNASSININFDNYLKNATYIISNLSGNIIKQSSLSKSINIEELSSGWYFLHVFTNKKQYTESFFVPN